MSVLCEVWVLSLCTPHEGGEVRSAHRSLDGLKLEAEQHPVGVKGDWYTPDPDDDPDSTRRADGRDGFQFWRADRREVVP